MPYVKRRKDEPYLYKLALMKEAPPGAQYYWCANWYKVRDGRVFKYSSQWVLSNLTESDLVNGSRSIDGFEV